MIRSEVSGGPLILRYHGMNGMLITLNVSQLKLVHIILRD